MVVRHALRHPAPALHHRHYPSLVPVGHQIRTPRVGVAVSLYQSAYYVYRLPRAAGLLNSGGADFVHQAAFRAVFAREALVGTDADPVFIYETVARLLPGKFEPEAGAAVLVRGDVVDVEHLFAPLVFVVAEINIAVGRGVPPGDDAEAEDCGK